MSDDLGFGDTENFKSGYDQGLSFKQICLEQFRKCIIEGSKEMVRGREKRDNLHNTLIAIPDQREIFTNSCEALRVLLAPKIMQYNKEFGKMFKEFDDEKVNLIKKYNDVVAEVKKKNKQVSDSFMEKISQDLVIMYRDKLLVAISCLLNHMNYFDEGGFSG